MNKVFNLISSFKAQEVEDGGIRIRGMASTVDRDRAGDIILADAWTKGGGLRNYEQNPIILYNHDHHQPIGRATSLNVTQAGLEIEARISKAAQNGVYDLIKDGILGAFSVGFLIKDADYMQEIDGLKIKDAELLEVSVVSVPCNQTATFSLAKSFDSIEEYRDFTKTFTNRVDLAGQSLANKEVNASSVASDTSEGGQRPQMEIKMSGENTPTVDLDALAKRVADETAAKIAMKQAEKEAAEKAAKEKAEKAAAEEARKQAEVQNAIRIGVESNAEKLLADFQAKLAEKDAKIDEVLNQFKAALDEKNAELTKIQDSKRIFVDRSGKVDLSKHATDLMYAHMLGVMTRKGWNTDFARNIAQKAGIDYTISAADIDQEVSQQIEKEIQRELRVARLFREIRVNGAATVLPIQPDAGLAEWAINATAGNLENRTNPTAGKYTPKQVILNAYRLVSSTYMDNDVDEQVLVNLMPMLVESVARAHARTVERTILIGDGATSPNIGGLDAYAAAYAGDTLDLSTPDLLTADMLLGARSSMGKYGVRPDELAYIVSQNGYYDLLKDAKFQTLDEVGSDLAARVTGTVGAVYGTPVVVSEEFAAENVGEAGAFVVNTRNYVIPRLRGVLVEQDYEVMNQRRVIVASQSLGFEEILPGDGAGTEPAVKIVFVS